MLHFFFYRVRGLKSNNLVIRFIFSKRDGTSGIEWHTHSRTHEFHIGRVGRTTSGYSNSGRGKSQTVRERWNHQHRRLKCNYGVGFLYGIILLCIDKDAGRRKRGGVCSRKTSCLSPLSARGWHIRMCACTVYVCAYSRRSPGYKLEIIARQASPPRKEDV